MDIIAPCDIVIVEQCFVCIYLHNSLLKLTKWVWFDVG